ncbi:copper chaperone PCu(A)C [Paroceanicella profunda]|uniref:Copper chaperone PCu(A)C n=1 Tax=Paroceanicella profunda TaxID=2579971 RepID=A0A5B8FHI7_9RHOB|nr:copper chaperone PCu(A)C [Paroceanicella profunda]QDL92471.1 copper chaperone PCu(A)C [Paroceanicella profunda]
MTHSFVRGALAALVALAALPALADGLAVEGAYAVRSNPMSGAAYMTLRNAGPGDDRLLSLDSPAAQRTELHSNEITDGVARMRPMPEGLPLPAGGTAVLERGGLHVMFMGLTAPLEDGEIVPLTLHFESGRTITVALRVTPQHAGEIPPPDGDKP